VRIARERDGVWSRAFSYHFFFLRMIPVILSFLRLLLGLRTSCFSEQDVPLLFPPKGLFFPPFHQTVLHLGTFPDPFLPASSFLQHGSALWCVGQKGTFLSVVVRLTATFFPSTFFLYQLAFRASPNEMDIPSPSLRVFRCAVL